MSISVICKNCNSKFKAADNAIRHRAKCPECKNLLVISGAGAKKDRLAPQKKSTAVRAGSPPLVMCKNCNSKLEAHGAGKNKITDGGIKPKRVRRESKNKNDLLKPSLSTKDLNRSIYSSKALFFTAFLGGALAVIFLSALNSKILNRLKTDIIFYIIAVIMVCALFYFCMIGAEGYNWFQESKRALPYYKNGQRVIAFIVWAVSYALHRKYHKTMALMEVPPLKPWRAAVICIISGASIQISLSLLVIYFAL